MAGHWIIRKIIYTRGGDTVTTQSGVAVTPLILLIIQRPVFNYSAYTSVATPQDIDQMIYFKASVWFFYFNRYCE